MRLAALMLGLAGIFGSYACGYTKAGTKASDTSAARLALSVSAGTGSTPAAAPQKSATDSAKVDFQTQIRPILAGRCQPCHFSGGKVYDKMPFDRPETIKSLGTKLFTRIKDENERRLISAFLTQQ
jgi:hypothetical protein